MYRTIKQFIKQQIYAARGLGIDVPLPIHTVNPGDQAWTIAADSIEPGHIVYSFGLAENIAFDLNLIRDFGAVVHGFDPTPESVAWIRSQHLPSNFHHHPVAIAAHDGTLEFSLPEPGTGMCASAHLKARAGTVVVPCRKISTIMEELGHNHIDLLKMDIEGAEYEVLDEILRHELPVRQILVEFHHRFPGIGIGRTLDTVKRLRDAGYKLFHVSPWCEEFAFLKIP
ncbi:MAG: FkbM family methyltransferase [Verrucomicrobiota bacterium]